MASTPAPVGPKDPLASTMASRKSKLQTQGESGGAPSAKRTSVAKEQAAKPPSTTKTATKASTAVDTTPDTAVAANQPRRKPRKLNKDPLADSQPDTIHAATGASASSEATSELAALKSRVRGLEAKVEELYKTGTDARSARSPRRRGKGRKTSSSTMDANDKTTVSKIAKVQEVDDDDDDDEEADEELVRLESELEVARQDLDSFHPRIHRTMSQDTEDVEEIPRGSPRVNSRTVSSDRQVTLSGSYRIPIPANVSVEDVKNIKSGVSAAQNVARTFLEQRRAAAALRADQDLPTSHQPTATPGRAARNSKPKAAPSTLEVAVENTGDKQTWGDWIGGYSMAITRAVKNIEHEAAMESQRPGVISGSIHDRLVQTGRTTSSPSTKKTGGRRPPAKGRVSSELLN